MLEIYNDKVRDLANPLDREKINRSGPSSSAADLKIRNHPDTGAYVAGLTLNPIANYAEAMRLITEGLEARTESATVLNHTSSRAHTIFSITIKKTALSDDLFDSAGKPKLITTTSKINLVDLAGSERVKNKSPGSAAAHINDSSAVPSSAGAGGGGMGSPTPKKLTAAQLAKSKKQVEEGINVNKSLTVLGKCILALTMRASGSKIHVPFRDSTLTFLLKESLQGNSRTFMVWMDGVDHGISFSLSLSQTPPRNRLSVIDHLCCVMFLLNSLRISVHPPPNTIKLCPRFVSHNWPNRFALKPSSIARVMNASNSNSKPRSNVCVNPCLRRNCRTPNTKR